jgi:hypothetical protein
LEASGHLRYSLNLVKMNAFAPSARRLRAA